MNKRLLAIFFILVSNIAYSQNTYEIKQSVKNSVTEFFSHISMINDPVEPFPIDLIVDLYPEGNYFYFNGENTTLKRFLNLYVDDCLKMRLITHELVDLQVDKVNDKSENDKRYKVSATLERTSATGEDIVIKDEKISMEVLWDNQCSILVINMNPTLDITFPTTRYEYIFQVDNYKSEKNISYEGGKWNLNVNSRRKTVKEYDGYPELTKVLKDEPWDFRVVSGDVRYSRAGGNEIFGDVGPNFSKETRTYHINLVQTTSNLSLKPDIYQGAKETFRFSDLFEVWDLPTHSVTIGYSLKYQLGLSYFYTWETRFSLGALIHANFNSFKDWKSDPQTVIPGDKVTIVNGNLLVNGNGTYESNGYKISVEEVKPSKEYSPLFDPYNTAKTNTARSLYMVQIGMSLNDYVRFDLGVGAAAYKEKVHINNAYKYKLYSYTPISDEYPPIDDLYSFSWYKSEHFFKGKYKWDVALRPGLTCCIPLDKWHEHYMNLGVGYVVVPNNISCNSLDFQLGISWYF